MANHIQVSLNQSIVEPYTRGWWKLRIARELGIDTKTVRHHIRLHPTNSLLPPTGETPVRPPNSLLLPADSGGPGKPVPGLYDRRRWKPAFAPSGSTSADYS